SGTAQFKKEAANWQASYTPPALPDVIYDNGYNGWLFWTNTSCTTGTAEPSWNKSEGATTSDGTCVWHASARTNSAWQLKDLFDAKTAINFDLHHNYWFNSWSQFAQGGGQGSMLEIRAFQGQFGPSAQISNFKIRDSIFDSATQMLSY